MIVDEISLRRFGQHCRSFYNSSLILRPSSSSLSSTIEEKKSDDKTNRRATNVQAKQKQDDGRIVIEALDRIIAIRSLTLSSNQSLNHELQSSIASLRQEHARIISHAHHSHTLMECGLLDVDRFICSNSTENDSPLPHEDDSSFLTLQQYTKLRDDVRRRAHQNAMLHRQNSLLDLLTQSSVSASSNANDFTKTTRMNEVNAMHQTLSVIRKFVSKYRSNIGSHSFLAGLHRLVDLQLKPKSSNDPFYIVRWSFNGSVLTEACRSKNNCGQNNSKETNNEDDLKYANDAINVLLSFTIKVNEDNDIESGRISSIIPIMDQDNDVMEMDDLTTKVGLPENMLSFEIDKGISNNNLRRILAVLPDPKCLDARATGHVEVVDASSSVASACKQPLAPRNNVDGKEDEQWPWFSFCNVL